jgi:hypothetical protein
LESAIKTAGASGVADAKGTEILAELQKSSALETIVVPQSGGEADKTDATKTQVLGFLDKLPAAPTLPTTLSAQPTFDTTLTIPAFLGMTQKVYPIHVDFSPSASGAQMLRGTLLALFGILFFFMSVRTIRSAVASE